MIIDYVLLPFKTDGKILVLTYTVDKKMKNAKRYDTKYTPYFVFRATHLILIELVLRVNTRSCQESLILVWQSSMTLLDS